MNGMEVRLSEPNLAGMRYSVSRRREGVPSFTSFQVMLLLLWFFSRRQRFRRVFKVLVHPVDESMTTAVQDTPSIFGGSG